MSDGHEKTMAHADDVLAAVDTFTKAVSQHEHAWHWKKLRVYAAALFERAPFKTGDRVRLTRTPDITPTKSWGWMGARHFLVKGALATVDSVDFSDGHFEAWLRFDDESWKDHEGKLHPPSEKALYHFWETSLERMDESSARKP